MLICFFLYQVHQAVILAGGFGTRISEETHLRPKPMVEIGGKPMLWHIMKSLSTGGISDFIICCGYKGYMIKEYFANYFLHTSDVTFHMASNHMEVHKKIGENWKVTLIDTGEGTMTGGRLLRIKDYITSDNFCVTYGDGLSDLNVSDVLTSHLKTNSSVTLTAVQAPGRFGALYLDDNHRVYSFDEKPIGDGAWVNGGFSVVHKSVLDMISGDLCIWEKDILPTLALSGKLSAYQHFGFWQCMDTLRDKIYLQNLWESNSAPWIIW